MSIRFFKPVLLATFFFTSFVIYAQRIGDAYPNARENVSDGIELYDKEKYNDAIEKLVLINENDSFYFNATYELALTYQKLKQFDKAKAKALEGLGVRNNFERDFTALYASILENTGQADSAIKVLDYGIAKDPYYVRFQYEKALVYAKQKDWDNALKYYTEALKTNVFYSYAHSRIGYIAANAKKPALALMAFNTFCMVNNNEDAVMGAILTMEKIASNEYDPDTFAIDEKHLNFAKDLEDVDLVIYSKAALSNKYKSLLKLNYNITKQMQVLCEKLPNDYTSENWLMNFYVTLHKKLWNEKYYVGSALHNLRFINNKYVQAELKSKAKALNAFQEWAYEYLDAMRNKKTITENGVIKEQNLWWDGTTLQGMGEKNEKKEPVGHWVYYSDYGYKQAEGDYVNGKKNGTWTYYYESGELKSIEEYTDGMNNGSLQRFYINGSRKEISTYQNDKQRGEIILYNQNNTISIKATVDEADKVTGTRYDYDSYGRLAYEREYKNSMNSGVYKTYHPNGNVNIDAVSIADNLNGKITYYYDDGKVYGTGAFVKGNRNGEWKWIYKNGNVEMIGSYVNGKESGLWKYYYEDGTLKKEENYENGTKKGSYKFYDREGKIYAEIFVKGGKIDAYKYTDKTGKTIAEGKTAGNKLHYVFYSEHRNKIREGDFVSGNEEGTWKYYYENGALEYELPYLKGKREGIMVYYFKNGKEKYKQMYEEDKLQGFYKAYYVNGQASAEGYYCDDERCGTWTYYNANGTLDTREFYREGVITGRDYDYSPDGTLNGYSTYEGGYFSNYHQTDTNGIEYRNTGLKFGAGIYELKTKNGKLYHSGNFKAGKRDSLQTNYYGNGKLISTEWFNLGKEYGWYTKYHENGKISQTGISTNGEQDSTWNYFNEQGQKIKTVNFKAGEYNGQYTTYYSNGKTEFECNYVEGTIDGVYKLFSFEGILILQADYAGGVMKSYSYLGKDGKLVAPIALDKETGEVLTYFPNGNVALRYKLENGWMQGQYTRYFENGKVAVEGIYLNDNLEGAYKIFYSNGNPKKISNYVFDELDGKQVEYYESGKIQRETNYYTGFKHGVSKSFDATGKQTGTINYQFNKIFN